MTLVVGIGNLARGDDGVGLVVARAMRQRASADATVMESDGEVSSLLAALHGRAHVILVDCCHSGSRPGTVKRFQADAEELPASLGGSSTHALGLSETIGLARALGQLPERVVVYAIEGRGYGLGDTLSPEVQVAVREVEACIASELVTSASPGRMPPRPE